MAGSREGKARERKRIIALLKQAAAMILDENAAEYFATIIDIYDGKRSI
jgi:hypothetical protein